MSGVLYNLYTNEVPILHKLLDSPLYEKLTFEKCVKFKNVYHKTTNFVDDSTSVITFDNVNDITFYLESYFNLLLAYY